MEKKGLKGGCIVGLRTERTRNMLLYLLVKLSNGWGGLKKERANVNLPDFLWSILMCTGHMTNYIPHGTIGGISKSQGYLRANQKNGVFFSQNTNEKYFESALMNTSQTLYLLWVNYNY